MNKNILIDFNNFKMIFKIAMPVTGTRTVAIANALISAIVLARLDHVALAVNAFITSSQLLISGSMLALFIPVSIFIARIKEDTQYSKIASYIHASAFLAFFVGIIIIIGCKNVAAVLRKFNQPIEIITLLDEYFTCFIWCVPALVLTQILTQFSYGLLKQKCVLVVNIASTIIFALSSYMLVLGKFHAPCLHIQGLALACNIKFWFGLFALLVYCCKSELRPCLKKCLQSFKLNVSIIKEIFNAGYPLVLQALIDFLNLFVNLLFAGWVGILPLLITQIGNQIYTAISVPLYAGTQACSVLVGRSAGNKEYSKVKSIFKASIGFGLLVVILLLVGLSININFFLGLLLKESILTPEFRSELIITLICVGICLIFDALISALNGALRGLLDIRVPVMIYLLSNWLVSIPLSYLSLFYLKIGPSGIFIAKAIGYIFTALILCKRWQVKFKMLV